MPVNFEQIQRQVKQLGETIHRERLSATEALNMFSTAFARYASMPELREQVLSACKASAETRCAIPFSEQIDAQFSAPPLPPIPFHILAADGSQISPNRHEEIRFGLVNTAVFHLTLHSGKAPTIETRTNLLQRGTDETTDSLALNEEQIGLIRDAAERRHLADASLALRKIDPDTTIFAITDGPLELFVLRQPEKVHPTLVKPYFEAFDDMERAHIIPAGYIDRPRADNVVQMINLLRKPQQARAATQEKTSTLTDSALFARFLSAEHRSAVFQIYHDPQSGQKSRPIFFFFLNTGTATSPAISRVEIPEWVATQPEQIGLLHAMLLEQNKALSPKPYPYALHRAHECAVVPFAEKDRIKTMIAQELVNCGERIAEKSAKQTAKDLAATHYS